jgi:hypothetical protein
LEHTGEWIRKDDFLLNQQTLSARDSGGLPLLLGAKTPKRGKVVGYVIATAEKEKTTPSLHTI